MTEGHRTAFITAATWHGPLDEAEQLLQSHPELAAADIHTAAITGNTAAVIRLLEEDAANATSISVPYGATALVYLCLSKYLRLQPERSNDFLQAAAALLDAGADPNAGFWTTGAYPEYETALYGAAGVAHHAPLTKILLQCGADPNDPEAAYHSPETHDSDAMKALVETGRLTPESLLIMLIRKHDWHDEAGVKYLLEQGADPNGAREKGWLPLPHALARCNGPSMIRLLLDHGADPLQLDEGLTAIARAAREGRDDILALFAEKGTDITLTGVDSLIAACAMGDGPAVQAIIKDSPPLLQELMTIGGELLARFCLSNNVAGVRQLLDIGVDVNTPYETGDRYFGIPQGSLAIHVAAWLHHPEIVQLLIGSGSIIDLPDKNGQTPLALAVKACVDSYWTERRNPDIVRALLKSGADPLIIPAPCGYPEVDNLLQHYRK
jgi:ankyrin repeat protein